MNGTQGWLCVAMILVCGSAFAQEGPPAPAADDLGALVNRLDSDDFAERESAQAALTAKGPEALEAIRAALAEVGPDRPELRERLAAVAAALQTEAQRQAYKDGGEPVNGWATRLAPVREEFSAGESILFTLEVANLDSTARSFVIPVGWDGTLPGNNWNMSGSHGRVEVTQIEGRRPGGSSASAGCGSGPSLDAQEIEAGGRHVFTIELGESRELLPGLYEAKATYYAQSKELLPGAGVDIVSNAVRFRVVPKKAEADPAPADPAPADGALDAPPPAQEPPGEGR